MRTVSLYLILLSITIIIGGEFYLNSHVDIRIEEPIGEPSIIRMSRKDAYQLDYFFRELMISEPFAYTLAGAKPMSFIVYYQQGRSLSSFSLPNLKIIRGWKLWKKYQHCFHNPKIKFWEEKSPWVNDMSCLIMADAEQCNRLIRQHALNVQPPGSDPFIAVEKVPFFRDTLYLNETSIGILLGFGEKNAQLYDQNHCNRQSYLPSIWDASITEKDSSRYSWKYCTLQTLNMSNLLLPKFGGDPDSIESQQLKKKYLETREKIQMFYEGKDFLTASLSLYKHGSAILNKGRSLK